MRYRSITLNENEMFQYSLVKYEEKYKENLEELNGVNEYLVDSVKKCPHIYSELSEHQSYMIFRGSHTCVGAINIGTSTDEKNLEVKVEFIENKFDSKENLIGVLEQLVTSLGMFFFDKDNIEVRMYNDISLEDLNKYAYHKYQPNYLFENVTTYTISNKQNKNLYSKLLNEIKETEQNLTNWKQCWVQSLDFCNNDINFLFDEELMQEYNNGTIPLNELFYKVESILWNNIVSNNSIREIDFQRNGQISFRKKARLFGTKNNYEFAYNILYDGFKFEKKGKKSNDGNIEIDENIRWTKINSSNINIISFKDDGTKIIEYKIPIDNDSSIIVKIYIQKEKIKKCYVDFRTHRKNGKVNGTYALRLNASKKLSNENICTLNFISRKGMKNNDFVNELSTTDNVLYSKILNEDLTLELIEELIKKLIPVINNQALLNNKPIIGIDNEEIILSKMEKDVINYIKQIKGEIPLPHLQRNLENFIESYEITKNDGQKLILKNKNCI